MNPYTMLGSGIGTNEAMSLSARLSAWHDAMVAHERRLRSDTTSDPCDDDCPHAEAPALWSEVVATFGPRAIELVFLRSRAHQTSGRSTDAPARQVRSEAAATANRMRAARGSIAAAGVSGTRPAAEL